MFNFTLFEMIHYVEEHLVQSVLVHSNFIQGCVRLQKKQFAKHLEKQKRENLHVVGVCTIWLTALGTRSKCYLMWGQYITNQIEYFF